MASPSPKQGMTRWFNSSVSYASLKDEKLSSTASTALCVLNLVGGLSFLLVAVCLAILVSVTEGGFHVPLYTHYPVASTPSTNSWSTWLPDNTSPVYLNIGYISVGYMGLAALDHLLSALPWIRGHYERWVEVGRNPIRGVQFFLGYGAMHFQVSALCGILDPHFLFSLYVIISFTVFCGYYSTHVNADDGVDGKKHWNFRFIALGAYGWIIWFSLTASYFFHSVQQAFHPPSFVWVAFLGLVSCDLLYVLFLWLHAMRISLFGGALGAEISYVLLSFISKQLVAWTIYGGIQQL